MHIQCRFCGSYNWLICSPWVLLAGANSLGCDWSMTRLGQLPSFSSPAANREPGVQQSVFTVQCATCAVGRTAEV